MSLSQINTAQGSYFSWIPDFTVKCCPTANSSDTHHPLFCRICHKDKFAETNVTSNATSLHSLILQHELELLSLNCTGGQPWNTSSDVSSNFSCLPTSESLSTCSDTYEDEQELLSEQEDQHFDYSPSFQVDIKDQIASDYIEDGAADYFGHTRQNEELNSEYDDIFMEATRRVPRNTQNHDSDVFDTMREFLHTYMGHPLTVQRMVRS